jgi:hypothetical protein
LATLILGNLGPPVNAESDFREREWLSCDHPSGGHQPAGELVSENNLLRLLEAAHPGASPEQLRLMLDGIPDKPTRGPVQRRVGARPRSPASVERRRSLAFGGWMPGTLANRFTVGETAVLAVIAQEVARHGACSLYIEQLAALAGVTRSTVKRALKEAHGLGFIRIEERRLTAWRNDANVVTIIDPAWSAWLRLRRRGEGSRNGSARNTDSNKKPESRFDPIRSKAAGAAGGQERSRSSGILKRAHDRS